MTTGKTRALTRLTFVGKVLSLLFIMLSRLVIAFLPRSKSLLISWLQSPSAVILEPPKIKSVTLSIVSLSICHEGMGSDVMILVFWILCFKPPFSLSSFTFIKKLFISSSLFCHKGGVIYISEVIGISPNNLDSSLCFIQPSISHDVQGLGAGGQGDDRGWDGWMASLAQWTWVWVDSGSWWWTRRPGVLWFMGSQRVRHNWATKLNWNLIWLKMG